MNKDNSDFSFKDIHSDVDKVLEKQKKKLKEDEFKVEHISDRVKLAKQIREQPPDKGFMNIEAKEAEVEIIEDGETKTEKGVAIISDHEDEAGKKFKKIAVYKGLFNIDLNQDAHFWFVRACNVFPQILDQGIRTHLDIKKAHEPEKRKIELPIFLIILVILSILFMLLIFNYVFGG